MKKHIFIVAITVVVLPLFLSSSVRAVDTTVCEDPTLNIAERAECYDLLREECEDPTLTVSERQACLMAIDDSELDYVNPDNQQPNQASACAHDFLGFPTWYKYLDPYMHEPGYECAVTLPSGTGFLDGDIPWLIGAAILEIVLRVSVLASVVFMVVGGYTILTSNGNPEGVSRGRNTIVAAIIGLVIAVMATSVVSFLADEISGGISSPGEGLPQVETGSVLLTIMNLLYRLAAGITVILVIISGINFATASGDPQQISKARNTIIYAAVGLVVTLLAVAIAGFVGGRL